MPEEYVVPYQQPSTIFLDEEPYEVPKGYVKGSRAELLKLFAKMASSHRLMLLPEVLVDPRKVNGLHTVAKDSTLDSYPRVAN